MPDKPWKRTERQICEYLGCKRRGPDVTGGKNDCVDCCYSVEITRRQKVGLSVIRQNVDRAEERAKNQIPIAVTLLKGMRFKDGIVSMRLETFNDWFGK